MTASESHPGGGTRARFRARRACLPLGHEFLVGAFGLLAERAEKPSRVVDLPEESWTLHSHVAHADYRAVEQHLVERRGDGRTDFMLLPHRSIDKATMTGVISAALARDVAYGIAAFTQLAINNDQAYEKALLAAVDRWLTPNDDDPA